MSGTAAAGLTLLQVSAPWCGACRLADPIVARVLAAAGDVQHRKLDVAAAPSEAAALQVSSLPTLLFLGPDGRELGRLGGPITGRKLTAALEAARARL